MPRKGLWFGVVFLLFALVIGFNARRPIEAQPALPQAFPGDSIAFDQPAASATEAATIQHTVAWDGAAKSDLVRTCAAWTAGLMTCSFPLPAGLTAGTHTVSLTAYTVGGNTRYESAATTFSFTFSTPVTPPAPSGCRIIR